jgi:hypothetical protein
VVTFLAALFVAAAFGAATLLAGIFFAGTLVIVFFTAAFLIGTFFTTGLVATFVTFKTLAVTRFCAGCWGFLAFDGIKNSLE